MWVALLRGVNVGGHAKLPMADLKRALEAAGCRGVVTYLQSGNAVFEHAAFGLDGPDAAALGRAIEEVTGMAVPVLIRSGAQLRAVIEGNPFDEPDPTKLHVGFLAGPPAPGAAAAFAAAPPPGSGEAFALEGDHLYLHLPDGAGRSRLLGRLGVWGTPVTVRNWRTLTRLAQLATAQVA